jgi:hypothetical protein
MKEAIRPGNSPTEACHMYCLQVISKRRSLHFRECLRTWVGYSRKHSFFRIQALRHRTPPISRHQGRKTLRSQSPALYTAASKRTKSNRKTLGSLPVFISEVPIVSAMVSSTVSALNSVSILVWKVTSYMCCIEAPPSIGGQRKSASAISSSNGAKSVIVVEDLVSSPVILPNEPKNHQATSQGPNQSHFEPGRHIRIPSSGSHLFGRRRKQTCRTRYR